MNPPTNVQQGRAYLYEVYQNRYDDVLSPAVAKFRSARDSFDRTAEIVINGGPLTYQLWDHRFVQSIGDRNISFQTIDMWHRDHLIYNIDQFAKGLFGDEAEKQACVQAYLHHKLGGLSPLEFVQGGELNREDKIWGLLVKIEGKKLLSGEEKAEKQAYLASDEYKVEQIDQEIRAIDVKLQNKEERLPEAFNNIEPLIVKVEERLGKNLSETGKAGLRCLLDALKNLKRGVEAGQRIGDIKFQKIFDGGLNYRNCLNDYHEIDCIYEYLEHYDHLLQNKQKLEKDRIALVGNDEVEEVEVVDELVEIEEVSLEVDEEEEDFEDNLNPDPDPPRQPSWISKILSPIGKFFMSIWTWLKNLFS